MANKKAAKDEPEIVPITSAKIAVEKLAERRGFLPQFLPSATRVVNGRAFLPPANLNPNYWKFAAAKAYAGWPVGAELSETDFDLVVEKATGERIG